MQSVTSIRQCMASLQGLSSDEIKMCLDVEASASVGDKFKSGAEMKHCQEAKEKTEAKNSFSSSFSDRWAKKVVIICLFGGPVVVYSTVLRLPFKIFKTFFNFFCLSKGSCVLVRVTCLLALQCLGLRLCKVP